MCATCSPHRIIIPHQYIVRPPGSDIPMPPSFLVDGLGSGYFESSALSGGERVRLCNPCVPDPNTAPPQSPSPSTGPNSPSSHSRSRSSLAGSQGVAHPSNRFGALFIPADNADPLRHYSRARSITMVGIRSIGQILPVRDDSLTISHRIRRPQIHLLSLPLHIT